MALRSSMRAHQIPQILFRSAAARRARSSPRAQGFADTAASSSGDADVETDKLDAADSSADNAEDTTDAPLFSKGGLHVMPGTVLLPRVPQPLNPPQEQLEAWDWTHVRPYVQATEDPHPIPRLHREYEDWDSQADPDHEDWADTRADLPVGSATLPLGPELRGTGVMISTRDVFEVGIVPRARWEMEKAVTLSVPLRNLRLSKEEEAVLTELVAASEASNEVFALEDGAPHALDAPKGMAHESDASPRSEGSKSGSNLSSIEAKASPSVAAASDTAPPPSPVLRVRMNQFPRRHDNERFAIASTQAAIRHAKRIVALDAGIVEKEGVPELWGVSSASAVKFDDIDAYTFSDRGQSQITLDGDFNEFSFVDSGRNSAESTSVAA